MLEHMWKRYSFWQGSPPPQYIFKNLRFIGVALEPPDWKPGSWCGAGKAVIDYENEEYLLTSRPRKMEDGARGYAAEIYRSKDGVKFSLVSKITKEEVTEKSGIKVWSIEGTQLLKDPLTGNWHFYLSVDTGPEYVVGGVFWDTMLFVSDDLKGPWKYKGFAIRRGHGRVFDSVQARNATIDIIDGLWMAIYRATDLDWRYRMGLAVSSDGIYWEKKGPFTVDGTAEHTHFATMGSIFPGSLGPVLIGLTWRNQQGRIVVDFTAYRVDDLNMNLQTIFRAPWTARSKYEDKERPTYGHYCTLVHDRLRNRILFYLSAVDPRPETKKEGWTEVCVRELVYECPL